MKIDVEKALLLTAGIILSIFIMLILSGCKKEDVKPEPPISQFANRDSIDTYTLSLKYNGTSIKLFINGEQQNNLNETFTLKDGDKIEVIDNGRDRTRLSTNGDVLGKEEGLVYIEVIKYTVQVSVLSCRSITSLVTSIRYSS